MASAQVVLRGRFKPGAIVRLVKVRDESVLRSEGGQEVDTATVSDDGEVRFTKGVEDGARYLIEGYVDGFPLAVRARGRAAGDESGLLDQAPIGPDRVRLSDGSWADEPPEQHQKAPDATVAPGPAQHQVPKGQWQRSDTPRGAAHPHDPREQLPYPDQGSVKKGAVQMSDTEHGIATPVVDSPERQDQVPAGVWQRSATPLGVATVIHSGSAVDAKLEQEASATKGVRGEPGKAAADPPSAKRGTRSKRATPSDAPEVKPETSRKGEVLDATGQPVAADVAAAAGGEADEPRVPDERSEEERTADVGKSKAHGTSVEGGKGPDAIKQTKNRS